MGKLNSLMLSDIDGFDTEGRAHLLEIIDKLRELGISESVSLPQVTHPFSHALGFVMLKEMAASCRRRSIKWEVLCPRGDDRLLLPGGQRLVYSVRNTDCPHSSPGKRRRSSSYNHTRSNDSDG
jgi:hypothetical protein